MESIIKQKIDAIAECIFTKIQKIENESFGLYSGEFGILLFLFYYSRYSQNRKYISITENYAERLFEQFIEGEKSHTFCNGFSGILYLFEFLRNNDFIDMDVNDIQPALDNYLVDRMRQNISENYYDFMHGALGVGLYILRRGTGFEYIQELIDFLYVTAEKSDGNQIIKWKSFILDKNEERLFTYNFALSHGISSIIIFLTRVVKTGMLDERIVEMLTGAVNYLLSQEKDFSQLGSYFPHYILIDSPNDISKSRMAWCYGDLGIGLALWQAGKVLEKTACEERGLEILLQSTKRRSFDESYVRDAGICHGSAGVAMIFRRMYLETKRNEFEDAAQYWVNQTLNFSRFENGLAGYMTLYSDDWKCDYSLLTGIAGIGLVLLSFLENNQQTWDEMFLLS
jgi:lantibiotic modifying enzyme